MRGKMPKMCLILIIMFFLSTALFAQSPDSSQTETKSQADTETETARRLRLFPPNDPISQFLIKTVFLPVKMLTPGKKAPEPEITEEQDVTYDLDKIPLTLDDDITLLIDENTGTVEYLWSQKDDKWLKPDADIQAYLQERYNKKEELKEVADKYRSIKSMQKEIDRVQNSRSSLMDESRMPGRGSGRP